MKDAILQLFIYFFRLLLLTLGTVVMCGLSVRLCAHCFSRLLGHGAGRIFDVTAAIGTPIHELGHAIMCPLFGHRITKMRLWSPNAEDGMYGYVEHSYSKRNLWARLGNLFIGIGPIVSGLCIVALTLSLCFPEPWREYLAATRAYLPASGDLGTLPRQVLRLLVSILHSFGDVWWRSLLGSVVMLSVALHISMSWVDVKSSLGALPIYLFITLLFAAATTLIGVRNEVIDALRLFNLRVLSLFCVVIAVALVWVAIALLYRMWRAVKGWF